MVLLRRLGIITAIVLLLFHYFFVVICFSALLPSCNGFVVVAPPPPAAAIRREQQQQQQQQGLQPRTTAASGRRKRRSVRRFSPALSAVVTTAVGSSDTGDSSSTSSSSSPAVQIENLSCTHDGGSVYQLDDVNYVLQRGAKVGLVGRNGSGKTTLLKILAENTCNMGARDKMSTIADQGYQYTGQITSPRDVRVAFVEQEPPMSSDITVDDALLGIITTSSEDAGTDNNKKKTVYDVVRRYRYAMENARDNPSEFTDASADMDSYNGWDVLTKVDEIATKLRVQHLRTQFLSRVSGGERKRIALAAALVQDPDVLLLDEPTNFLSLAGVQWLTDLLTSSDRTNRKQLTILMVTHDRAFLDDVCDRILELDNGKLYEYKGKYANYLEGRQERLALLDAAIQSAKTKYKTELEWMRRQPQARESKSKSRIDAFYKLEKATKPRPLDPSLSIGESIDNVNNRRIGGKILSMRNVSLRFGDRVMLDDFSYDFCKGDRLCLAGANGVGKTTLIRVLSGEIQPDSGTIDVGETIQLGVYDQLGIQVDNLDDPSQTVLNYVLDRVQSHDGTTMSEAPADARKLLKQFQFPRQRWNERVSVLSGGERRRLQMLSVFSQKPNFLVMDEPSVDCDLDTLRALEEYLVHDFDGVLVIVSHDRAFADKVTDHVFIFEGDGVVKDFFGTLSEYAATLIELENESIPSSSSGKTTTTLAAHEKKVSYKEEKDRRNKERNAIRTSKKTMANLEKSIERLKEKAAQVQEELDRSSDKGWSVLSDLTDQLNTFTNEIDEKEMKWMELAEKVEEAEQQE